MRSENFLRSLACALAIIVCLPAPVSSEGVLGQSSESPRVEAIVVNNEVVIGPGEPDAQGQTSPDDLWALFNAGLIAPAKAPTRVSVIDEESPSSGSLVSFNLRTGVESISGAATPRRMQTNSASEFTGPRILESEGGVDPHPRDFSGLSLVDNPQDHPWRVNCIVLFSQDGVPMQGSGVLVDPLHVLTAGHVVHSGGFTGCIPTGAWSTDLKVYPGASGSGAPYGPANGAVLYTWTGWSHCSDLDHDIGLIQLDRPVGALTGWHGYSWVDLCSFYTGNTFYSAGYPAEGGYDGCCMYEAHGSFDGCEIVGNEIYFFREFFGGQSGSGAYWFNGATWTVYAVYSNRIFGRSYFPKITQDKFDDIEQEILNATPSSFDLVALDVNASPTTIDAGQQLTSFDYLVHNYSSASFSGTVSVGVYLSTNQDVSTFDTLIQTHNVSVNLGAKSSTRVTLPAGSCPVIPAQIAEQGYYLGVVINISDDDSGNNSSDGWDAETIFVGTAPPNSPPDQPTNALPLNGQPNVSTTPIIAASTFSDPDIIDSHGASQWQIDDASSFGSPVWDSGVAAAASQISVPAGILNYDDIYYWRVRYRDNRGLWSAYSSPTWFRTFIPCDPPSISVHPESPPPVCEGGMVSLSAAAEGTGPLAYEWRRNGESVPGATSPTLVLNPASVSHSGAYDVVVTGQCGSPAVSNSVTVTVNPVPVAPSPLASPSTICSGNSTTLSASVSGAVIDWYMGSCGQSFLGTGNSLPVQAASTTTFYARSRVSSTGCESASCGSVTISVNPLPPTPLVSAEPSAVCLGGSSTLSASAAGSEIDWFTGSCGGTPVGTGASLVVTPTESTVYYARARYAGTGCVSSDCGFAVVVVGTDCPTLVWDGGGVDEGWGTAANWNPDRVPTQFDSVLFDGTSSKNCMINQSREVINFTITSGYAGSVVGQCCSLELVVHGDLVLAGGSPGVGFSWSYLSVSGTSTISGGTHSFGNVVAGGDVLVQGGSLALNDLQLSRDFVRTGGEVSYFGRIWLTGSQSIQTIDTGPGSVSLAEIVMSGDSRTVNILGSIVIRYSLATNFAVNLMGSIVADSAYVSNNGTLNVQTGSTLDARSARSYSNSGQVNEIGTGKVLRNATALGPTSQINFGTSFYIVLRDDDENTNAQVRDQSSVLIKNLTNGDQEALSLTETDVGTAEFVNSVPGLPTAIGSPTVGNGILEGQLGACIEIRYVDNEDTADVLISSSTVQFTPGDCDGNGVFEPMVELPCFITALLDPASAVPCGPSRSDLNGDGATDARDIQLFIDCALNGCP